MQSMQQIKSYLVDKDLSETLQAIHETIARGQTASVSDALLAPVSLASTLEPLGPRCNLGDDLLSDVELLDGYNVDANSVYSKINMTCTHGGSQYLKTILGAPTHDGSLLSRRRDAILAMSTLLSTYESHLDRLGASEASMAWVYNSDKDELISMCDVVYFTTWFTTPLNKNDKALTAYNIYRMIISPTIGILAPVSYVLVPYFILRTKLGIKLPFFSYVKYMIQIMFSSEMSVLPSSLSSMKYLSFAFTLIFYFQGVFNSIELAGAVHRICKLITEKINGFVTFVKAASALTQYQQYVEPFFDYKVDLAHAQAVQAVQTVQAVDDSRSYSVFDNFGKQLALFRRMNKAAYIPIINQAYMLDAIASFAKNTVHSRFAPVTFFEPSNEPHLVIQDTWHPCLDTQKVVTNSIRLDNTCPNNIVLTGPNAGGKSTIIKSILVNVLLAQTAGVACTKAMELRPYNLIKSQINIPDCKGKESLFEAEMYRSKSNIDSLDSIADTPNATALIVMDEIFNSTNPVEGIAGAYAIAKHMAAYKNATCIITTHYLYLTKLAKDPSIPSSFQNYKMNVVVDKATGEITYPYKLKKGISRQFIALELLKKNGFDASIIEDAIAIKKKLSASAPSQKIKSALEQEITESTTDVSETVKQ